MSLEIEHKFLVKNNTFKKEAFKKINIKQGFLNSYKKRVVRVRITNKKGFLTIKGKSNKAGTVRFEWEKEIPLQDAENLLLLCEKGVIKKTRYYVKYSGFTFEIDEFFEKNSGLIIAEIELEHEHQSFSKPSWLGKEVTGKKKYYNACLSKKPFSKW